MGKAELKTENPIHPNNLTYMHVTVTSGDHRIDNVRFSKQATRPGITIHEGADNRFSIWLRQVDIDRDIMIALENFAGELLSNEVAAKPDGTDFVKNEGVVLTAVGRCNCLASTCGTGKRHF